MDSTLFNKERCENFLTKMNKDESRIFLMVGMKEDGTSTFVSDNTFTPERLASFLEGMAKSIRQQNKSSN